MSKIKILLSIICVCVFSIPAISQDRFAAKTNLLYGGVTLTPNLGVEFGLGRKTSLELFGAYNAWNIKGSETNNKKLAHWLIQPAFRYWFCERFSGHFIGVHALYTEYNISGHNIPLPFNDNLRKEFRYQGNAVGAGISYGYDWALSRRLNLEFEIGVGYAYAKYDKYECQKCGTKLGRETMHYFGPTKVGITLVYIIK